ncbi:MAG TPA: hypothetical protein ENH82_00775 [bacterium]|nr:hypothetical protein [bacterium]
MKWIAELLISILIVICLVATVVGVANGFDYIQTKDDCWRWADKCVKSLGTNFDKNYVIDLYEKGEIKGIPKGYYDESAGCCIDRMNYKTFYYKQKYGFLNLRWRNYNEVRVVGEWIDCDNRSIWGWPPKIEIQKQCFYCEVK